MKITLIQPDLLWENRDENLRKIEEIIDSSSQSSDLFILPEMFSTGFSMNTSKLAEGMNSHTVEWMKRMAVKKESAICGSIIVKEKNYFFNRFLFVTPGTDTYIYDKRHLFGIGGENENYKAGRNRLVFRYKDFNIHAIICYDLRFPVWIRNRNDYDLLICVSNWPDSRRDVWNTLLKARAIENQCFVAGVNRVGRDDAGNNYTGDSVVLNPKGQPIASLAENTEGSATCEISISDLTSFRKAFPVWKDADDFKLIL